MSAKCELLTRLERDELDRRNPTDGEILDDPRAALRRVPPPWGGESDRRQHAELQGLDVKVCANCAFFSKELGYNYSNPQGRCGRSSKVHVTRTVTMQGMLMGESAMAVYRKTGVAPEDYVQNLDDDREARTAGLSQDFRSGNHPRAYGYGHQGADTRPIRAEASATMRHYELVRPQVDAAAYCEHWQDRETRRRPK